MTYPAVSCLGAAEAGPSFAEKLAYLRRRLQPEREVETRSAHVLLTPRRAYKIKKPITLGYLDHRRLAARERSCREELRLNRELAGAAVYLGVAPLTGDNGSMQLDGTGRLIDWLVVMRRLPGERMLETMLQRGDRPDQRALDALVARLAAFYAARQAEPAHPGVYLGHLRRESEANQERLSAMRRHLSVPDLDALTAEAIAQIEAAVPGIAAREAARQVVEGHGDLRPEHICLTRPPVIFDRVEFAPEMRMIDIGDELAFLGLECRLAGAPEIGPQVIAKMAAAGYPPPEAPLVRAYSVFRCLTRARLCIDHLNDPEPRQLAKWPVRAVVYLNEARRLLAG